MKKHKRHLTERDLAILNFVSRYRIGTEDMFSLEIFHKTTSPKNVSRVVRRLEGRGLLRKESWDIGCAYYTLTPRGCRVLRLPPQTPRPLTEQSLPVVLAIAFYCVRHGVERLTNKEFAELYPEFWRPGLRSSSYVLVDTPVGPKLEMLLIDRGGMARRIRSRVRRVMAQRIGLPDFVSLIDAGRFRLNVLVGTAERQDKLRRYIERESFDPVEVMTTVVPELANILSLRT